MKTVHITNYYHKDSGGISTSYNALLEAANRHRIRMSLIVPGAEQGEEQVGEFGKIYFIPARYSPIFDKRYRVMMPWQYMMNGSVIREVLLNEMPDVVEVTDKYTLSIMGAMIRTNNFRKLGRPMLVHFSCERMDDNISSFVSTGRMGRWLARKLVGNYILPSFDFHIANSPYTAEELFTAVERTSDGRSNWLLNKTWRLLKAPRVPLSERIAVCPRGVDAKRFTTARASSTARERLVEAAGIPSDSTVLLYAGRISPEKNIALLPAMMERLKDDDASYRLVVAGDGPLANWLQKQSDRRCGGNIVLLGHLDKDTLADHYANCDIFVHPNPKEPFGIAPLEAMASGVPVVAPDAGGLLFYANDENAWLVEPKAEAFARAVREIINNQQTRNIKVENALKTAAAHTRERSTDFLIETYQRLWDDFQQRNELFTDREAAGNFDFVNQLVSEEGVPDEYSAAASARR